MKRITLVALVLLCIGSTTAFAGHWRRFHRHHRQWRPFHRVVVTKTIKVEKAAIPATPKKAHNILPRKWQPVRRIRRGICGT